MEVLPGWALGLGIYSMTGQKRPIVILSKLGHSISYEKVLEIETAQAEVAEQFRSNSSVLPIHPVLESTKVTIFKISLPGNKNHHNLICTSTSPRLCLIKQFLKLQTWRGIEGKKDIIFINQVRALMIFGFLILFSFKVLTVFWYDNSEREID